MFDPYFYSIATDKQNNIGKAAIQYVTFQDMISYHTSLNPDAEIATTENNGTILVDMQDTVQGNFSGTFNIWADKDAGLSQQLKSNQVMIPAYHRIYDFTATEVHDQHNCVTGEVALQWYTKYPDARKILTIFA